MSSHGKSRPDIGTIRKLDRGSPSPLDKVGAMQNHAQRSRKGRDWVYIFHSSDERRTDRAY